MTNPPCALVAAAGAEGLPRGRYLAQRFSRIGRLSLYLCDGHDEKEKDAVWTKEKLDERKGIKGDWFLSRY